MRTRIRILLILICTIAMSLSTGCHRGLGKGRDLNRFDPNVLAVRYARDGSIRIDYNEQPALNVHIVDQIVIKLHKQGLRPIVKGKLSSGREYPVLFDSGAPRYIYVQQKHIRENNLPYRPLRIEGGKPVPIGLSYLDNLEIGNMQFEQARAIYIPDGPDWEIFGIPFGSGKLILLSLEMMREFKYICIDDIKKK